MVHDVFISYSSKDKVVADSIVAALENNDIRCWYAPRDIKPGADWGDEIAKSINASSVFLLIFSNSANQSQRVLDELNLAISKEVVILPFRIEKLDPSGAMLLHLSSRHWLDAFVPSWEKHIDNLVKSVSLNLETGDSAAAVDYAKSYAQPSVPKRGKRWIFGIVAAIILFAFAAIFGIPKLLNQAENSPADMALSETSPAATITPKATIIPTDISSPTPDGMALGNDENPIVWMYVPPDGFDFNDVSAASDEIVAEFEISNQGLSLKIIPAPDMSTIIEALCDGEAHIGSLGAFSFMVASSRDCAEVKLIWSAYSDINFGGMIVTDTNSNISDISHLEGKTLCIPVYSSISGWILPSLEIRSSVGDPYSFFSQIIEIGDHSSVIEGVYNGQCDAGAAYYDARDTLDLPGINERITILFSTTPIPNQNLSFSKNIDAELTQKLVEFFLNASSESDNFALVSGYYNSTETKKLIEINDYYYNGIWDLFQRAGANPEDFLYTGF